VPEVQTKTERWHAEFLEDLDLSFRAQLVVANYLAWNGWSVVIPGFHRSPTREQAGAFKDKGDLFVKRPNGTWGRVEVRRIGMGGRGKGVPFTFTGPHDFGPPGRLYDAVRVMKRATFDEMRPRPWRVVCVSNDLAAAAVIDVNRTFRSWHLFEIPDAVTGGVRPEYMCPIHEARWMDLRI
jgi:hypothetical protein